MLENPQIEYPLGDPESDPQDETVVNVAEFLDAIGFPPEQITSIVAAVLFNTTFATIDEINDAAKELGYSFSPITVES